MRRSSHVELYLKTGSPLHDNDSNGGNHFEDRSHHQNGLIASLFDDCDHHRIHAHHY